MSSIKWGDSHTCLVVTDAEVDGLFAMALLAKAKSFQESCKDDLHIAVVMPDEFKRLHLQHILRHLNVKIYDGTIFNRAQDTKIIPRTNKDVRIATDASEAIKNILKNSENIRILVIGPCTDLAQAIERNGDSMLENVIEIVWAANTEQHDGILDMSRNLLLDLEAADYIFGLASLRPRIKLVSLSAESTYAFEITTNNFEKLYDELHLLAKVPELEIVACHSSKYTEEDVGKDHNQIPQKEEKHLRAGNIVAALVMFHHEMVKAYELLPCPSDENSPEISPSKNIFWSCFISCIECLPIPQNAEAGPSNTEEVREILSIREIHEDEHEQSESLTKAVYFKTLVLQLLAKYTKHQ